MEEVLECRFSPAGGDHRVLLILKTGSVPKQTLTLGLNVAKYVEQNVEQADAHTLVQMGALKQNLNHLVVPLTKSREQRQAFFSDKKGA
jgi:hypothetical protein